jgi:hypothetical protein
VPYFGGQEGVVAYGPVRTGREELKGVGGGGPHIYCNATILHLYFLLIRRNYPNGNYGKAVSKNRHQDGRDIEVSLVN